MVFPTTGKKKIDNCYPRQTKYSQHLGQRIMSVFGITRASDTDDRFYLSTFFSWLMGFLLAIMVCKRKHFSLVRLFLIMP